MGKPPLFRQRRRSSAHQSAGLGRCALVEPLENRIMLAADITAANVFAQFAGTIVAPNSTVSIPLHFSSSNFKFSGKSAVLGVQVVADGAGGLDPALVQIKDARNRTINPFLKNANSADRSQSLALANFSSGKYTLRVSSDRKTTGSFVVNLFLAGDANGDGKVDAGDVRAIRRNMGKRDTQSGFAISSDANRNGVIDAFDVAQAGANINDRTTLKVLALSALPQSAHPLPDGSFAVASSPLSLVGKTLGKFSVSLDRDGDGFDDGTVKAGKTGAFLLPATLSEGLNTLRLRVADSVGQQKIASVSVTLDSNGSSPIGVAASLDLDGSAKDLVIIPGSPQLAYIATGTAGLAIVDVTRSDNPVLLGQIDLPGEATSLAIDSRLHIAALATGPAGLQLVNVVDPSHPAFLQTIGVDARAVAIVDGIAYVATSGGMESYDLLTAEPLQTLPLAGGAVSLAVEGSTLYTMDSDNRLRIIDLSGPSMIARGSLVTPEGGGRIFVANQIAYVAASGSVNGGFDTVDVRDPDSPLLISASDIDASNTTGNAAIAANGSGLAIEVGQLDFASGGQSILDVFDTSDLADTADSVRRIILPDAPSALAISSGIAFVADGIAGLQMVNYAPADDLGIAPTASLESLTPDAFEGTTVHLQATVADDVQVRWIDLLINGNIVATKDSLPFDLKFDLPKIAPGVSTVTAQIRATDTGGNTALSNLLTFNLIPDTTAPSIVNIDPPATSIQGPMMRSIRVNFSESMDPSTLTAQNIRLVDLANHAQTPLDIQIRRDDQGVQLTYNTLPAGAYQIVINTAAVKDRAGHAVGGANVSSSFKIVQGTIIWNNPAGGDWSDPANWNPNRVPNSTDDVFISAPAGITITHSSGADTVHSLRANSPFTLSGGTLTITSSAVFDDSVTLSGGTLNGAGTITTNSNVTWSGTVMEGPGVTTISRSSIASVPPTTSPSINSRTLNINGTLALGSDLRMSGSAALNNGGMLELMEDAGISASSGTPTLNNSGTLNKARGSDTSIIAIPFTNHGVTSVAAGTLSFSSGGSTTGRMTTAAGSSIQLNSSTFSINHGATFDGSGTLRISSGVNNFNAAASIPNLALEGGSIASPTHATLSLTNNSTWTGGTVSNLTLNVADGAILGISGNSAKTINAATINNAGTTTWTGDGEVLIQSGSIFNNSGTFTIQNDSSFNNNGGAASTFNNSGTVAKSTATGSTSFGLPFNNNGTITANTGTIALANGGVSNGTFNAAGGEITLSGTHTINDIAKFTGPTFTRMLGGTTTLSGSATAQNFAIQGGTLDGPGTLTISGALNWTAGTMTGSGLTRILDGGVLNITGSAAKSLSGRTITNEGSATWSGSGGITLQGVTFNNAGSFTVQNDLPWGVAGSGGSIFNNTGTLIKSAGSGSSTFAVPFSNSGSVVASSGKLIFNNGGSASGSFAASASTNITFSVNDYTFNDGAALSGAGMFHLPSSTITINGAVSVDNLSMEGATINGPGTLTVGRVLNWSSGIFAGSGTTTIAPAATFTISSASGKGIDTRTINNQGNLSWIGTGGVFLTNGSTFNNSGQFAIQNDSNWTNNGGLPSTFNNSGSISKATGTATSTFNVTFNNNGTVSASSGVISLNAGGASSGNFVAGVGSTITFGGGTHALDANSSLSGAGTVSVSSGLVTLDGNYSFPGTLAITAGTAYFNSTATLANLNVNGSGTFGGSGVVHIPGAFNWIRGTLNAGPLGSGNTIVDPGGTLAISGTIIKAISHYTLSNAGSGSWSDSGNVLASDGALFTNSGTFSMQADASWLNNGGTAPPAVNNNGTMTKSAGTGVSEFKVPFNNLGTVHVQSGSILLTGGGSSSGNINIDFNTTVNFASGNYTFSSPMTITGAGAARITGATVTPFFVTVDNLKLESGTINGSGALTVNGIFDWLGGTFAGTGTTNITLAATLSISGSAGKTLSNRTINNAGSTVWSGGDVAVSNGSIFDNKDTSVFLMLIDGNWSDGGGAMSTFINRGSFTKGAGIGNATFGINVQNQGTFATVMGGVNFGANLFNSGDFEIGSGMRTVSVAGNFNQTNTGILEMQIGGTDAGSFDKLVVGGTATLLGTLNLSLANSFVPAAGNSFQVLSCNLRAGIFDTIAGPAASLLTVHYNSNNVTLSA